MADSGLSFLKDSYSSLVSSIKKAYISTSLSLKKFNSTFSSYSFQKKLKIIFVSFIIIILLWLVCWWLYSAFHIPNMPPPLPVETAGVRVGPLEKKIPAIGVLQANESVILRPEVSGRIDKILFVDGQAVTQGMPLISLDNAIAQENVKEMNAEFELAKADYERANTLLQKNVGSVLNKDTALAKYQEADAALSKAKITLSKMQIQAPFSGFIGIRKVGIGDYVEVGQALVNLVDIDPMKVDFRIAEIYLEELKLNQIVEIITDAFPNQTFIGKIYAIDPQIDPLGHSILVRAIIDNKNHQLKPGLFVELNIVISKNFSALFIPTEALIPQESKIMVFKVENNKVKLTEVTVGQRLGNEVEIISGLNAGDNVVTAGQLKLQDGMPITAIPSIFPKESSR